MARPAAHLPVGLCLFQTLPPDSTGVRVWKRRSPTGRCAAGLAIFLTLLDELGELEEEEKDEELEKRDKENRKRKREDVKVVVKVKGLASSIGWKDRAEAGRGEE